MPGRKNKKKTGEKKRGTVIEGRTGKRNRKKARFYFLNILLAVIIVILGGGMSIWYFCGLNEIKAEGNTFYTAEELSPLYITDKYCVNTVYVKAKSIFVHPEMPEFINSINVKIADRNTILLSVNEKSWLGYLISPSGSYVYYNSDGNVIEVSERLIEGQPTVYGVLWDTDGESGEPVEPVVGKELPVDPTMRRNILQLQRFLKAEDISYEAVMFAEDGQMTVITGGGTIYVNLGTSNLLQEKIRRLPYILPELVGQSGILHLEDWTTDSTDIVFEKN